MTGRLRVTHAPVNIAGIPWENVMALRRKGVDARLVVFERGRLHPEADWSLDRRGALPWKLAQQFAAFARLVPRTERGRPATRASPGSALRRCGRDQCSSGSIPAASNAASRCGKSCTFATRPSRIVTTAE